MKSRTKCNIFILFIMLNLSLVFVSPVAKAEEYQLGFENKTRLTLIYEYTKVDSDLLDSLADTTGVEEYDDLAEIDEGDKLKMIISEIDEEDDYWLITIELYSGKDLDQWIDDLEARVYKKPEKLANRIFDSDTEDTFSIYFMPLDIGKYLEKLKELVIEDDEYLEADFELFADDTKLTFDYTMSGYSDKLVHEYDEDGILESFEIKFDGISVFKRELIESYEDYSIIVFIATIITISIVGIISVSAFVILKRKNGEPLDSKNQVDKMLQNVK